MSWPVSQDYNEAVQNPRTSFADGELQTAEVVTNALGLPMPRSGNFADVYEFRSAAGARWAVKCFTRPVAGLRDRYDDISQHLRTVRLPFTVEFTYLDEGIRIRGRWFPVLKMQWVEGLHLNELVRDSLDKPAQLDSLGNLWVRMARRLRDADVGHGDLQHGNVLLVPGSRTTSLALKLIDYDGMYVPTLANAPPGEAGHPAYQHPRRSQPGAYGRDVDRFPLLVIACAIRALTIGGADLWKRYDNGDNLLFREVDLRAGESALFRHLWKLPDPMTQALTARLALASLGSLKDVPLVDEITGEGAFLPLSPDELRRTAALLGPADRFPVAAPYQPPAEEPELAFALPSRTSTRPRGDRLVLWAWLGSGAVLFLAAVVALGAYLLTQDESPPPPPRDTAPAVKPPDVEQTLAKDGRLLAPDEAAVEAERAAVREAHKEEYDDPQKRLSLAARLLKEGQDARTPTVRRYVCLREARDLAAQAGDPAAALVAVGELAAQFAVEARPLKVEALTMAAAAGRTTCERALALSDEAVADDDLTAAGQFLEAARGAAIHAEDNDLFDFVEARTAHLKALQTAYDALKPAMKVLDEKPDDRAGNRARGLWLALFKDDWPAAFKHLPICGDKALSQPALREIARPTTAPDQTNLADGWWEVAEAEHGLARTHAQDHARFWYRKAWPSLTAMEQAQVEPRLARTVGAQTFKPGLAVEDYADEAFTIHLRRRVELDNFRAMDDVRSCRRQGVLVPPLGGTYRLVVNGEGSTRVLIDDVEVLPLGPAVGGKRKARVTLTGQPHKVTIDHVLPEGTPTTLSLSWARDGAFAERPVSPEALGRP